MIQVSKTDLLFFVTGREDGYFECENPDFIKLLNRGTGLSLFHVRLFPYLEHNKLVKVYHQQEIYWVDAIDCDKNKFICPNGPGYNTHVAITGDLPTVFTTIENLS